MSADQLAVASLGLAGAALAFQAMSAFIPKPADLYQANAAQPAGQADAAGNAWGRRGCVVGGAMAVGVLGAVSAFAYPELGARAICVFAVGGVAVLILTWETERAIRVGTGAGPVAT